MYLGIIGDTTIELIHDIHIEWISRALLDILNRGKPDVIVTFNHKGTAALARRIASCYKIVLTNSEFMPSHCDLAVMDNDMLEWVDWIVIVSNGQYSSIHDKYRHGKIYEINYLERSAKWITYESNT